MRRISETVLHRKYSGTVKNARGNTVDKWDAPADLGIYAFNPGSTDEPHEPGHAARVVTTPSIYVPSGVQIGARDRVTVRGQLFEVQGVPLDYRNPYGSEMNGMHVHLEAVTG